ncbi:MAG: CBS domain-containing protein, partial [Thermoguttaceae bacterium]
SVEDLVPHISDLYCVRSAFRIPDDEILGTARELLLREGILAGSSSGTLVAAALRYCRQQTQPKRVVTLVCDSGNKYLSKMYNDFWMGEQGLLKGTSYGDLRDLIARRFTEGAVVSVGPDDPLAIAYTRMRLYDVSQLPVLEGRKIVGILDESDLLLAVARDQAAFRRPAREVMTANLQTVSPKARIEALLPVFGAGLVAIVAEGTEFYGLITRMDVLSYLRRRQHAA